MSATVTFLPSTTATAIPSCVTATPNKYGYVPPEACNAQWAYSPSFSAAIAYAVLFGILTITQTALAIFHRKGFCWAMIMGALWELVAFVSRAMAAHNQQSAALSFVSNIFFLLAPLWINAFAYMTAGRMIWTFHPDKAIWKIKAISIGKYFVWLDILSFLVQGIGGTMLNPGNDASAMKLGQNIYMAGVGGQQFFIVLFTALIVRFHLDMGRLQKVGMMQPTTLRWKTLAYALYAVLALISMRIIYRLIEFSAGAGVSNPLPYHEIYPLILDAFPMVTAITILTVIHPGMVLKGPESEFPSRKETRAAKKAKKAEKKAAKNKGFMGLDSNYEPTRVLGYNHVWKHVVDQP
ncbi:RTA1 domain-containing protein [Pleomassaria siparia CBS 279.74]|uniref:RTA1 domain-containing protein n=1 Tax=Pleomassaria siparia CBS 279.74 TaxID=1314801 RepID=A0A6G1K2A2_9PLEO|nr:RTA1 domain-containing protein [Pleomassaria siparia CBS 279.74]